MPLFQNDPPNRLAKNHMPILRTEARGKAGGVILATNMIGCYVHFYGRSMPCTTEPTCPICSVGQLPRWTAYLPVWSYKMNDTLLLELPTGAAEQVDRWIKQNGSLRHKLICCTRPKGKVNSKIKVAITSPDVTCYNLPPGPDVYRALCLLWSLDPDDLDGSLKKKMNDIERYQVQENKQDGHH